MAKIDHTDPREKARMDWYSSGEMYANPYEKGTTEYIQYQDEIGKLVKDDEEIPW